MSFEKQIYFTPAFDKRSTEPGKDYGIHGVDLIFALIGEKGAISFEVYTNWQLPNVQAEFDSKPLGKFPYMFHKPNGSYVQWHSPVPMTEGEIQPYKEGCKLLKGRPCYSDGSGLLAEEVFKILVEKGSDGVWTELERIYEEWLK